MKSKFIPASVLERVRKEAMTLTVVQECVRLSPRPRMARPLSISRRKMRPTFCVCPEKQSFRCHSCGVEADAIDFVMKLKRCGFKEAVAIISTGYAAD
jgi:DNA primase